MIGAVAERGGPPLVAEVRPFFVTHHDSLRCPCCCVSAKALIACAVQFWVIVAIATVWVTVAVASTVQVFVPTGARM